MRSFEKWVQDIRREFHMHPELSFHEYWTQERIISILKELGVESRKIAGTGVVADIRGKGPGPCIAIRSDMDALAVHEPLTSFNKGYISQNPGIMHACGHDGHIAIVLGVARLIMDGYADFCSDRCGSVRLIFQPAEELPPGGALKVIDEGGLDGVDAIIGLHIFGDVDAGVINVRSGPFMASSNRFCLKIIGKGGHHSTPQYCIDPIQIVSEFISSLHHRISKKVPSSDYVLGFGTINSGRQFNRIPDVIELEGSFRTFSEHDAKMIEMTMSSLLDSLMGIYSRADISAAPSYELHIQRGYPVLFNDPLFTDTASMLLRSSFPYVDANAGTIFGAEDFAYYLQKVPGMYVVLGTRNMDKGIIEGNHSASFDIDEDVLIIGAELLRSIALDFLKRPEAYLG